MRTTLIVITLFMVGIIVWNTQNKTPVPNPDPNHIHADFAVWINGEKIDFAKQQYMSTVPATTMNTSWFVPVASAHEGEDEEEITREDRKFVHLHDMNGDVIHVHKPGITLGDFFHSLDFDMQSPNKEKKTMCMQLEASAVCDSTTNPNCKIMDLSNLVCNEGFKKWRMMVNGLEQPYNSGYVIQDTEKILLSYGADDAELQKEWAQMTDEACMYSKTCPWKGDPPTENCIADPTVPCVVQ